MQTQVLGKKELGKEVLTTMWMQGSKPPKKGSGGLLHHANTSARVERAGEGRAGEGSADDDVEARKERTERKR